MRETIKKQNIFFKALVLALLVAGGVTFTSCVKQKNCQATRRTFIVEGELHYVSDEEAYLLKKNGGGYQLEPSDIPSKYQVDGILVRASLVHKIAQQPDEPNIHQVKCIESM